MFWNRDNPYKDFADRVCANRNELDAEVQALRNDNIELRKQLAELQEAHKVARYNATFAFDFKTINAFSIERNIHNDRECTIIGYLLPKETIKDGEITNTDVVREWCLYCSAEQHERLVAEFKEVTK